MQLCSEALAVQKDKQQVKCKGKGMNIYFLKRYHIFLLALCLAIINSQNFVGIQVGSSCCYWKIFLGSGMEIISFQTQHYVVTISILII